MTGDDDLRRRLRDVDPARPGGPTVPQQSPSAHEILERAMRTADLHDSSTTPQGDDAPPGGRPWLAVAGIAAAAAVAVGGVALATGTLGGETDSPPSTLALTAAPGDAMGMCMVFDVQTLAAMPVALAGTVTSVAGETVTIDVDRWYRGGDADQVTVATDGQSVALDGVDLVAGADYLLTATDGVVNGCGYSGPTTPELRTAFDEAFGG